MDQKHSAVNQALIKFNEAALNLHKEWLKSEKLDGEALEIEGVYPFHQDFGEMCALIQQWTNSVVEEDDIEHAESTRGV